MTNHPKKDAVGGFIGAGIGEGYARLFGCVADGDAAIGQFALTATRKNCGAAEPPACNGTVAKKGTLTASMSPELPAPVRVVGAAALAVHRLRSALK